MFSTIPRPFARTCNACNHLVDIYLECDINLNIDFIGKFVICSKCMNLTLKEIEKIKNLSLNELPLYINHDNTFVKEAIKKRLRDEIYHS